MNRSDAHRPSAINPADYEFVAFEVMKMEGFGDVAVVQQNRDAIRAHMARTGGTYSRHQHGGNCHICGSVNAIYTALFYHAPSNSYIRTGTDCTDKLDGAVDASAFRASLRAAAEHRAGKAKAEFILGEKGLSAAWDVYARIEAARKAGNNAETSGPTWTVYDIVSRLVKYGSISDKAAGFLGKLIERIARQPEIDAARKAENDAAAPAPVTTDRIHIRGTILSVKVVDTQFGRTTKCLVRTEAGWKAYGTCPDFGGERASERGDVVEFDARFAVSQNDAKFGFFSRPTKAKLLAAGAAS